MNSRGVVIIDFVFSVVIRSCSYHTDRRRRSSSYGSDELVIIWYVYRSWMWSGRGQREFARDLRTTESRRVVIYMSWVQSTFMRQATTSPKSTSSNPSTVDCRWTHRPVMYNDRYIDCWLDFIISLWQIIFPHSLFIDYPALSQIIYYLWLY